MRSLNGLFRNFLQLGYVTDDIDAAAAYLESAMGRGKCVKSYTSWLGAGRPPRAQAIPEPRSWWTARRPMSGSLTSPDSA